MNRCEEALEIVGKKIAVTSFRDERLRCGDYVNVIVALFSHHCLSHLQGSGQSVELGEFKFLFFVGVPGSDGQERGTKVGLLLKLHVLVFSFVVGVRVCEENRAQAKQTRRERAKNTRV